MQPDVAANRLCFMSSALGSKELHSEILHYTYDIHDHCLPRHLMARIPLVAGFRMLEVFLISFGVANI